MWIVPPIQKNRKLDFFVGDLNFFKPRADLVKSSVGKKGQENICSSTVHLVYPALLKNFNKITFFLLRFFLLSIITTYLCAKALERRMFFPPFSFFQTYHKSRVTAELLDQVKS